ncbi:PRC-barrel domain-containing protein [Sphingomonas ginkgonis]|nr:PRC-barrel domain-containing protein [Sphingomonas ginkgonis]
MTASNLGSRVTGWGFGVFTIGSIAWIALGLATGQPNLVWQNAILTALNLFGIWRWLGRQAGLEKGAGKAAEESSAAPGEDLFPVSLLGKGRLVTLDGDEVGSCVDAMAQCQSGRLAYLVASEGGVAGVGETLRRVDWKRAAVDGDRIRLRLDRATFASLPTLEKDRWPGR